MKFDYGYISENDFKAKHSFRFLSENTTLFVLMLAAFLIPVIFGHVKDFPNQLLVGSLVNTFLATSALFLTFKKSLSVILLPAIAAVVSSFIFGPLTIFLVYLVPLIWLGNAVYVYLIKKVSVVKKTNYALSVIASAFVKSTLIFSGTFVLFSFGLVPEILLMPMGLVQFATATIGGLAAGLTLFFKE